MPIVLFKIVPYVLIRVAIAEISETSHVNVTLTTSLAIELAVYEYLYL